MSPAPVFVRIPGSHHPGTRLAPRTRVVGPGIRTHTGAGDTVWQPILNLYNSNNSFCKFVLETILFLKDAHCWPFVSVFGAFILLPLPTPICKLLLFTECLLETYGAESLLHIQTYIITYTMEKRVLINMRSWDVDVCVEFTCVVVMKYYTTDSQCSTVPYSEKCLHHHNYEWHGMRHCSVENDY